MRIRLENFILIIILTVGVLGLLLIFLDKPRITGQASHALSLIDCNPGQTIGDVNNDGLINNLDVDLAEEAAVGKTQISKNTCCIDVNNDGQVNIADVQKIINIALGKQSSPGKCSGTKSIQPSTGTGCEIGDANQDGNINIQDIDRMVNIILGKNPKPLDICCSDLNKDNKIDIADLQKTINIITGKQKSPGNCKSTTQTIGPLPSRNIPNCVTPPQPQTGIWQIDKSTTLCLGTYDLPKGVEIIKNNIKLDCNGATLFTNEPIYLMFFKTNYITITNCFIRNKNLGEEIGIFGSGTEELILQNNLFDSNVVVSYTGNVNINYNNFNEGELTVQEVDKTIIENNRFINECDSLGSWHEYGSINFRKNVQHSQIKNNEVEDKNGCSNDKGVVIHYQNYNNIISDNNIKGMTEGIFFRFEDNANNVFSKNRVENSEIGIFVRNPKDLDLNKNNSFIKNNLINNNVQIEDHNRKPNVYENNYITGFSDDPQQCNDINNDNICNNPYLIYSIPPQYGGTQQTQIDLNPRKIPN